MYYSVFGTVVALAVGVFASWLAKSMDENQYSVKLLHPIVRKFIRTSESYANDDISNSNELRINRKSTVYTIHEDILRQSKNGTDAKYTQKLTT